MYEPNNYPMPGSDPNFSGIRSSLSAAGHSTNYHTDSNFRQEGDVISDNARRNADPYSKQGMSKASNYFGNSRKNTNEAPYGESALMSNLPQE